MVERVRRQPDLRRRPRTERVPAPGPGAALLALQRAAGNAAVARALSRRVLARDGWPEARKGGWNEQAQAVAGTLRIPLKDLPTGNKDPDKNKNTSEVAGGSDGARAIAVVPDAVDLTADLEVLLLFHGLGGSAGIGYRERTTKDAMGDPGTVHDVEADLIEQQLAVSDRNMVALLAQGRATGSSRFDIADPAVYVDDALKQLKAEMAKLRPGRKLPVDKFKRYRVVVAGHSGGGPPAVASAAALQGGDWHRSAPLLLFDAINGPNELKTLRDTLTAWLEEDKRHLLAAADPGAELARRGLKFRSTYSVDSADAYLKNHEGGDYELERTGKPPLKVHITKEQSVNGFLDKWFKDNATGKLEPFAKDWQAQYVTEKSAGSHHHQIGARHAVGDKEREAAPAGLTGAAKDAKVPVYKAGTGNLEKALKMLPKDARRPRAQAHAMLEPDPDEVLV
jgi:hypothetical protein